MLLACARQLFLVGFASLILPGTQVQLVVAFCVSLVFFLLIATALPYANQATHPPRMGGFGLRFGVVLVFCTSVSSLLSHANQEDDFFAKACSFALTAVFFFSMVLKQGALTESVEDTLPADMRSKYVFDAGAVSAIIIAIIVSALALAVALCVQQVIITARLPIIKLDSSNAAPELTLRPHHHWHLFLSHVVQNPRFELLPFHKGFLITLLLVCSTVEHWSRSVRFHQAKSLLASPGRFGKAPLWQ